MSYWGRTLVVAVLMGSTQTAVAAGKPVAPTVSASTTKAGVDAWSQGDYTKAVGIWRPLAGAGDADAQFNLGQAYKLGRGVPVDLPVALEWFRKATLQGHVRAETNYGLLLFQQNKREEAMPYISRAADRGDARAQYLMGTALYNGDLAPRDWVKAYAMMTQAAGSGLPQARTSLETMDQYIPEAQRQQGLAMATQIAQKAKDMQVAVASPAPAPTPPAPRPIRQTDLPPSEPAAAARPLPAPVPAPKPAPVVRPVVEPAVARGGNWRVQLGAFSEDARARGLWASLSGRVSGLSAYQPYLVKGGAITRLQAGPMASQAEAEKMCRQIKAAGTDCLIKQL